LFFYKLILLATTVTAHCTRGLAVAVTITAACLNLYLLSVTIALFPMLVTPPQLIAEALMVTASRLSTPKPLQRDACVAVIQPRCLG